MSWCRHNVTSENISAIWNIQPFGVYIFNEGNFLWGKIFIKRHWLRFLPSCYLEAVWPTCGFITWPSGWSLFPLTHFAVYVALKRHKLVYKTIIDWRVWQNILQCKSHPCCMNKPIESPWAIRSPHNRLLLFDDTCIFSKGNLHCKEVMWCL